MWSSTEIVPHNVAFWNYMGSFNEQLIEPSIFFWSSYIFIPTRISCSIGVNLPTHLVNLRVRPRSPWHAYIETKRWFLPFGICTYFFGTHKAAISIGIRHKTFKILCKDPYGWYRSDSSSEPCSVCCITNQYLYGMSFQFTLHQALVWDYSYGRLDQLYFKFHLGMTAHSCF